MSTLHDPYQIVLVRLLYCGRLLLDLTRHWLHKHRVHPFHCTVYIPYAVLFSALVSTTMHVGVIFFAIFSFAWSIQRGHETKENIEGWYFWLTYKEKEVKVLAFGPKLVKFVMCSFTSFQQTLELQCAQYAWMWSVTASASLPIDWDR